MDLTVPQDIIDNVVDALNGDKDTLKSCAVVSRSFFTPSRRNFFSNIHLDDSAQTERLYNLLVSRPEISSLIHELTVTPAVYHRTGTAMALANILRMLSQLRSLLWGHRNAMLIHWTDLSSELQSALVDSLQSPNLTIVKFIRFRNVPMSVFNAFTRITTLSLIEIGGDEQQTMVIPATVLAYLHTLQISNMHMPIAPICIPNLRRLLITGCNHCTISFVQQIIARCTKSIKQVEWKYSSSNCSSISTCRH
jgi:hypothetical protein